MIQSTNFGRSVLLGVFDIDSNAWNQRAYRGETAMAFGFAKPVFANQYGELDLLAVGLTLLIAVLVKIDMATAACLVRDYWCEWLEGVADAERLKPSTAYLEGICFVVATDASEEKIVVVEVGPCNKIMERLGGGDIVPYPIPLDLVVRRVRALARKAKLSLPKYFTPGPSKSDEFKKWIAEIEDYRRIASMEKGGGRKKAKVTERDAEHRP